MSFCIGDMINADAKEYECPICYNIMFQVCELDNCGHLFCNKCIQRLDMCPLCKNTNTQFHSSKYLQRKLFNQKVKCFITDCDNIFTIVEAENHLVKFHNYQQLDAESAVQNTANTEHINHYYFTRNDIEENQSTNQVRHAMLQRIISYICCILIALLITFLLEQTSNYLENVHSLRIVDWLCNIIIIIMCFILGYIFVACYLHYEQCTFQSYELQLLLN